MLASSSGRLSPVVAEEATSSSKLGDLSGKGWPFPDSSSKSCGVDLSALPWVMCQSLYQPLWPERWNALIGQAEVPSWS